MNRLNIYFFVGWPDKKLRVVLSDGSQDQVKQYQKVMTQLKKKKDIKELKKL